MGNTIAEKILLKASGQSDLEPGDIVEANVDIAMSHDNAALVSKHFRTIGVEKVWDPNKIVILLDHRVPANSVQTATGHKAIREFVSEQNLPNFYDMNAGICHQILPEKGHVRPGELVVGTDSHTTTHGAFGAFATAIGATEMSTVWATGHLWLKVPETVRMEVSGSLPDQVYSKDVILNIIGTLGSDYADYKAVEFYGNTISALSVASRMVVSNQAMEMGSKAAIIPPDEKNNEYVRGRTDTPFTPVLADEDAEYLDRKTFDVSALEPQIACQHSPANVKNVSKVAGTPVDQAFLGSCTNGRLEDLEVAVNILKGKKIASSTRMIIIPASWEIYSEAMHKGFLKVFMDSGAIIVNPGCGPCLGAHEGILADGEKAISSSNRNFKGRMGSTESEVYLSSPAVVAASALKGEITDPRTIG
ncbi:MAG: 3-isopropylmalate dehydratase large subunit [Methanobacteriota archaeon]|nr:MAG: 3-isopropylmalate dehydratase large subunit [Euryarchaeota archaeon]